mgnify:FL=1
MITVKAKEMNPVHSIRYMDAENATMENLMDYFAQKAAEYGLVYEFQEGEISYGLFSTPVPCTVLIHPKHLDWNSENEYFKFCFTRQVQGKTCTIEVSSFGRSTQMKAADFAANTKIFDGKGTLGTAAGILRGGAVGAGFAIGSAAAGIGKAGVKAIAKGINALIRDPAALAEEQAWYDLLSAVIGEVLN